MDFITPFSSPSLLHLVYFLSLIGAMASCWFLDKKITLIIGGVAAGLGLWLSHIYLEGAIALILMGVLISTYDQVKRGFLVKPALFLLLSCFVILFYEHLIPGFQNLIWVQNIHLSMDSTAYRFYLNADKMLVALMLLVATPSLNKNLKEWVQTLKVLPLPFLWVALVLLGTAFAAHYIRWDVKISPILWWWIPANLFLVCTTEEIFFRGFIQNQLSQFLKGFSGGKWVALVTSSVFFGLYHHAGGPIYMGLATLAGIGYGYVYLKSQRIESSILLHFSVNLVHILLFSYPALVR